MLYFKNREGNKMIGVENGIVTEFYLLFTGPVETFYDETLVVEPTKTITLKNVSYKKTVNKKAKSKGPITDEEKREKHKAYMVEYNKKYKSKLKAKKEATQKVEPNQALINEFGKSTVDALIICKRQEMTAEEIHEEGVVHCGYLTISQLERILDVIKA